MGTMTRRIKSVTANLIGLAVLFLVGAMQTAHGQDWQTPIQLTDGLLRTGGIQFLVDSLNRIHIFTSLSREPWPAPWDPNTLTHYVFDNWGRPLAEPRELLPDTHLTDFTNCGGLIDSQGRMHVVWRRRFDDSDRTQQVIYVRMSLEGTFLQEPLIFTQNRFTINRVDAGNYHIVENTAGEIWVGLGDHFFAVDVDGNLVEPLQSVYGATLAAAPDGSVWTTCRKYDANSDSMFTIRLWPPPRIEELTLLSYSPGFGPQAFAIDSYGSFHYVIYNDGPGLYYQFDPRNGLPIQTAVIDSFPYGVGQTRLIPIGTDSLLYMWGQTLPEVGLKRVCFTTGGEIGSGPTLITPPNFALSGNRYGQWRDGGYWIPGFIMIDQIGQIAMLHIPGPNEPLAVGSPPSNSFQHSIEVYPQPNHGSFFFDIPFQLQGEKSLTIYNLLGQRVFDSTLPPVSNSGPYGVQLPLALPTGMYLLSLSTQTQEFKSRIILVK